MDKGQIISILETIQLTNNMCCDCIKVDKAIELAIKKIKEAYVAN